MQPRLTTTTRKTAAMRAPPDSSGGSNNNNNTSIIRKKKKKSMNTHFLHFVRKKKTLIGRDKISTSATSTSEATR